TAIKGRGSRVAVAGEAGLGKTRLVEELGSEASRGGVTVLRARAYEAAQILSYGVWTEVLREAGVVDDASLLASLDPVRRAELSRLLPGAAVSPPARGPVEAFHAFEAIAGIIPAMSRRRPPLIVGEDAHWADEMSIRFLGFLGRRV